MKSLPIGETRIDLSLTVRQSVCELLNQMLADNFDLYSQTKQAHWTVRGTEFWQLHRMFDKVAEVVESHLDEIAERITALGGFARGTVRMAAGSSDLPEFPERFDDLGHVTALAERFAHVANHVREAIDKCQELGDASSADLLTDVSRDLDKQLWFLEAHSPREAKAVRRGGRTEVSIDDHEPVGAK